VISLINKTAASQQLVCIKVTPQERVLRIGRRNARIRVTRRGQLLIRGVASGDAGIYRCLSQSRDRRRSVAKDIGSVRLHVIDPTDSISRPLRRSATVGEEWRATCSINVSISTFKQMMLVIRDS